MSTLSDRVSYIKGLAEGMKLDTETNEGKIIEKMLELLSDMAVEMDEMQNSLDELDEYVDSIDHDLSDMEDLIYGEEDECGCGCDCDCEDDDEYTIQDKQINTNIAAEIKPWFFIYRYSQLKSELDKYLKAVKSNCKIIPMVSWFN